MTLRRETQIPLGPHVFTSTLEIAYNPGYSRLSIREICGWHLEFALRSESVESPRTRRRDDCRFRLPLSEGLALNPVDRITYRIYYPDTRASRPLQNNIHTRHSRGATIFFPPLSHVRSRDSLGDVQSRRTRSRQYLVAERVDRKCPVFDTSAKHAHPQIVPTPRCRELVSTI